jgi:uncharacterized protein YndB with AHSA1/START domain
VNGSAGRTDSASLVIGAKPSDVYRAFSSAGALMAWLPPGDMTGRALEYDFRNGGRYRIELTYGSEQPAGSAKTTETTDVTSGRFVSLAPGERIVQTVEFESEDAAFSGEMTMTWAFDAVPEGTRVTVTAENVPAGISKADHDAGLRSSLENLAKFCSSRS